MGGGCGWVDLGNRVGDGSGRVDLGDRVGGGCSRAELGDRVGGGCGRADLARGQSRPRAQSGWCVCCSEVFTVQSVVHLCSITLF